MGSPSGARPVNIPGGASPTATLAAETVAGLTEIAQANTCAGVVGLSQRTGTTVSAANRTLSTPTVR